MTDQHPSGASPPMNTKNKHVNAQAMTCMGRISTRTSDAPAIPTVRPTPKDATLSIPKDDRQLLLCPPHMTNHANVRLGSATPPPTTEPRVRSIATRHRDCDLPPASEGAPRRAPATRVAAATRRESTEGLALPMAGHRNATLARAERDARARRHEVDARVEARTDSTSRANDRGRGGRGISSPVDRKVAARTVAADPQSDRVERRGSARASSDRRDDDRTARKGRGSGRSDREARPVTEKQARPRADRGERRARRGTTGRRQRNSTD